MVCINYRIVSSQHSSTPILPQVVADLTLKLCLRVCAIINSQILGVEAPGWQGVKEQEHQAYSELSQRCQAGCIGA
jgi:hypothetical protein